jgi:hypothetical protein
MLAVFVMCKSRLHVNLISFSDGGYGQLRASHLTIKVIYDDNCCGGTSL